MLSLLAAASLTALDFHPLPNTLSQIEALKRLYVSTNGASWEEKMNEGWMKVERGLGSECAWDGVECDPEMSVIGLELSARGLRGALAPPAHVGPRSAPTGHPTAMTVLLWTGHGVARADISSRTHSPAQARCRRRW